MCLKTNFIFENCQFIVTNKYDNRTLEKSLLVKLIVNLYIKLLSKRLVCT